MGNGDVFIYIVKMFLIRLCLLICVNLFLYAKCSIPVERLCANPACTEPISIARTSVTYTAKEKGVLSFPKGVKVTITSKNNGDNKGYWGAVINKMSGYVPSQYVLEEKIFHEKSKLMLVSQNISFENVRKENTLDQNSEKINVNQQQQASEIVNEVPIDLKGGNKIEKPIKPAAAYTVFDGTTIYMDEIEEIKPSATVDVKSTHTAAPINKELLQKEERAKIPPELVDLNSNLNGQNLGSESSFKIENVKENDENSVVESKDMYADGEGEEEDDEKEEEEKVEEDDEDTEEEEDDEDDSRDELAINMDNQFKKGPLDGFKSGGTADAKEKTAKAPPDTRTGTPLTTSQFVGVKEEKASTAVPEVEAGMGNPSTTSQFVGVKEEKASTTVPEVEAGTGAPLTTSQFVGVKEEKASTTVPEVEAGTGAPLTTSQFVGVKEEKAATAIPIVEAGTGAPLTTSQFVGVKEEKATTTIPKVEAGTGAPLTTSQFVGVKEEKAATAIPEVEVGTGAPLTTSQFVGVKEEKATTAVPEVEAGTGAPLTTSQFVGVKEEKAATAIPEVEVGTGAPLTTSQFVGVKEEKATTAVPEVETKTGAPSTTSQFVGVKEEEATTAENARETYYTTPLPVVEGASNIFGQASVPADLLPEDTKNPDTPMLTPGMISEEVFSTTPEPIASQIGNQLRGSSQAPSELASDVIQEKAEVTTEGLNVPSVPPYVVTEPVLPKEEPKGVENAEEMDQTLENKVEELGMLSQITGMFFNWFAPAPGEEFPEDSPKYQADYQDFRTSENAETKSNEMEAPQGTCHNPELGFDCKESSEEQSTWADWIPVGLGLDNVLRQSNTPIYLIVTAVTVLLFTLGHNFIEKRGKTGPLIAKINKLEQELLVMSKECIMFKDEVQSAREKIILYENSANDELVVSLQTELEESKKVRSELESSIEVLQQELDAATEAGLDLNKMLSEVLTQKGGSETLLKSVESLQGQLDSQQRVIDEMTKKLGVKNQENEALQSALEAANDKSESLEEELADIKHNLNLHLKEKEDLTRELKARINHLQTSLNQLWQTKEEEVSNSKKQLEDLQAKLTETSSGLTVKEEEVKALKESIKHLKAKGEIKLETVFDFSRVKAELAKEVKENHGLLEKLKKEESSRKGLTEQMSSLEGEMQKLKKNFEEAEQKKDEAEKKLEVLSTYFKEKETQLQKELGLQEALWAQKKGDENAVCNMMKSLQEEVESYKSQNETLKKEILDQERGLKNQIAGLEQKAHENWVAARQAERKLEESKQEMSQLRNRLITLMDKNSNNTEGKGNLRSEELNGVEAASPILHDTSSPLLFPPLPLDPSNSNLLPPGFMPPPMFMPPPIGGFMPPPPFLPGDRRPPPLGRMSSPPLNSRFSPSSPGDYPFERMSSPPLSPPGSNYRSLNEDREHYRHRTPPYPPPLHPRNWDDSSEMPGFIPISSQRDSRRDHKGSNVSSEHSSSESLDKSSRHSGRV